MTYSGADSRAKADIARKTEEDDQLLRSLKPLKTGAAVLIAATLIAVFLNFLPVISFRPLAVPRFLTQPKTALLQWQNSKSEEPVEETPKVIYFQARPSAEPTPPPAITGFRLSAYGRELGPDGFTTYVEDKPVVLTLEIVCFFKHRKEHLVHRELLSGRGGALSRELADRLRQLSQPGLKPAVNATGIVLHTNLGRACLSEEAATRTWRAGRRSCSIG